MNFRNLQQWHRAPKLFTLSALFAASLDSAGQTTVAIAPVKMNVLYVGVDNPVSIATSGGVDEKVTVSISGGGGTVEKIGAGNYIVRVSDITDDCIIQVNVDGKLAGASRFRVRSLPRPGATVGGFISGSNIPAEGFRSQAGVGVYVKDSPFEVRYDVVSFTITFDDGKGNLKSFNCQGAAFSSLASQNIDQYVNAGRMVTIDNIQVKAPDGRVSKVPSLVYYIK